MLCDLEFVFDHLDDVLVASASVEHHLLHLRHFGCLEGHGLIIIIMTFAISKVSEPCFARQQCHLAAISELKTDVQHVAGKINPVADCLSRVLVFPHEPGCGFFCHGC